MANQKRPDGHNTDNIISTSCGSKNFVSVIMFSVQTGLQWQEGHDVGATNLRSHLSLKVKIIIFVKKIEFYINFNVQAGSQ